MKAKYIDLKENKNDAIFTEIGHCIRKGKLVVFPTETVYGIGTNGLDENSVKKIYEAKGRSSDNPLILHISSLEMLHKITRDVSNVEKKLMDAFFPGPLTLILHRTSLVPDAVTAGMDTVAVRMPSNEIARKLIDASFVPIAAPSANISGKPSGTVVSDIMEELGDKVDYIVDGGMCPIGLESTVVRVIDGIPTILRPGKITKEEILEVCGSVSVDEHVFTKCNSSCKVLSPGMKYRHYAPDTKCVLVYSDDQKKMVETILSLLEDTPNSVVISTHENFHRYSAKQVFDIGSRTNLEDISKNIFTTLRKVDAYKADLVIIEGVPKVGLGLAIMNRLLRACEYHYIEC